MRNVRAPGRQPRLHVDSGMRNKDRVPTASSVSVSSLLSAALAVMTLCLWSSHSMAETRGYAISWFATATHAGDFKLETLGGTGAIAELRARKGTAPIDQTIGLLSPS